MSRSRPTASILAIGTELTSGQTLNRNAAWISEKLTALGFHVTFHETVPDDHGMIRDALERGSARASLLVVTGGLGPTTDDFTRDVLTEWSGFSLVFREASWNRIVARLSERGIEVAESNRQQCYFPEGSEVFENAEGTADGFGFEFKNTRILVLPGPPREGQHLWETRAVRWLKERFPSLVPEKIAIWKTLGKSEAALGEIVEKVLEGSGLITGYRASPPYVEVKVWIPEDADPVAAQDRLTRLDSEIAPYVVARGDEDLCANFFTALNQKTGTLSVTILDLGTRGALSERLIAALKTSLGQTLQSRMEILTRYHDQSTADALPDSATEWIFALFPNGQAAVIGPRGKWVREIPSPYPSELMKDRLRRYRTEKALQAFGEILFLS